MKLGVTTQARRNLQAKPLQTALSLALLAFGVGMVSMMLLTEKQVNDAFERNIKDIDLVLGAKGSPLQLILANVYHIDAPTGNISLEAAQKVVKHPYIASAHGKIRFTQAQYPGGRLAMFENGAQHNVSSPLRVQADDERGRLPDERLAAREHALHLQHTPRRRWSGARSTGCTRGSGHRAWPRPPPRRARGARRSP